MAYSPNKEEIISSLKEYNQQDVKIYAEYIMETWNKSKDGKYENQWWMQKLSGDYITNCFRKVASLDLVFDGKNITLQSTWVSFNYVAYKNRCLRIYPETTIDWPTLVYKEDKFSAYKENGKVFSSHTFGNVFGQTEDNVVGWYIIIKNRRWEFFTRLSLADLEKHKATAKTQAIWKAWLREMYMKTIAKKWFWEHFKDDFQAMEELDNENYDATTTPEQRSYIDEIADINTIEDLKDYWEKNKGKWEDFAKAVNRKKIEIIESDKQKQKENITLPPQ